MVVNMEKEIYKVKPIIIYPDCIKKSGVQGDCHTCSNKVNCLSPRSMCVKPYKNHKYGCPNFRKLPTCPPNIPCMYDQVFDISDVYSIMMLLPVLFNTIETHFNTIVDIN